MNAIQADVVADPQGPTGAGKKVFIKTFGCQMNVYDSERMGDALSNDGYTTCKTQEEADLVILNTCHIREKAAEKVYSHLGRLRKLRNERAQEGKDLLIAVTGCVAQAEGEEMMARAPVVDIVAGPQTYHRIGEYVAKAKQGKRTVATGFEIDEKFNDLPAPTRKQIRSRGVSAFLTIQEGCDKFCTFCVVPYTRGAEVSRPVGQIVEEAKRLADSGVREVTLLGQNVNAWHGKSNDGTSCRLGELLAILSEIDGISRLRYTTSHPIDMDETLIQAHRDLPKLMPYLHLPVQAGSDRILKAMNRHHDRAHYFDIVDKIRKARPDIALSGDFIVGFPGESDAEFEETLELIRDIGYAQAFSFKYSPRPGTPGADIKDQVDEIAKSERLAILQDLLNTQQVAFNRDCVGKAVDLLIEKPGRLPGQLIGRSPWLQSVIIDANATKIGDIIKVRITSAGPNSLMAEAI
ncbi:MAG: tRNA (N6-isopentenyl adenosine(37)-C2)-methylthiotransferase MiaB [Pseudomonadota bacterium]